MKIVVLDAYAGNPGDISWDCLLALGETDIYDRTAPAEIIARAADAEVVLVNKVRMTREVIIALPHLRYIGVLATGYNVVDMPTAKERGIVVSNVPAYSSMSVAQMVFAHLLNITNSVAYYDVEVKKGRWKASSDFCFYDQPLLELDHLTMGIVGLGNTGMAVARIAKSFGMEVMAMSSKSATELQIMGISKASSYEQLFSEADVLSLHCPLNENTFHLVNEERLSRMKHTAILINTGRGPLVDEQALANALNSGMLRAAGIDVLTEEPPVNGTPLTDCPNCHITPHIAWATAEARTRLLSIAIENIRAFIEGRPMNVVSM